MKKVLRLTESDLVRLVKRVIREQTQTPIVNDTKKLMGDLDVILHKKFGVNDYTIFDCEEFMYDDSKPDGFSETFEQYEKWLGKNGFSKEWNTSRLCFGEKSVPTKNLELIKNRMIKLGWYK
jgi:hypothetical protein